jgi:nucleotide-binding universal stress UspA family protein
LACLREDHVISLVLRPSLKSAPPSVPQPERNECQEVRSVAGRFAVGSHQPIAAMKTVLAPIDFSDISRSVINEAVALARAIDARLVLLHVVQLPAIIGTGYETEDIAPGFHLETEHQAKRQLTDLQWKLRDEGVTAHVIHQVGSPGERIVQQAERLEADYIVMGSHGHGAFYDLIVGGTTTRVLKAATCPVVIVPAGTNPSLRAKALLGAPEELVDV